MPICKLPFDISQKSGKWYTSARVRGKLESKFMTNLHERWKGLVNKIYLGRNNIELTTNSQNTAPILRADTEKCGSTFIPNVGVHKSNHTASHSRRQILTNFVERQNIKHNTANKKKIHNFEKMFPVKALGVHYTAVILSITSVL